MTEDEWLTRIDQHAPADMFGAVSRQLRARWPTQVRRRKLLLFGVAACRDRAHLLGKPETRALFEMAEREAEEGAFGPELLAARTRAMDAPWPEGTYCPDAEYAVNLLTHRSFAFSGALFVQNLSSGAERCPIQVPLEVRLCALLRDIFGNPFQRVKFRPAWRTDTAVALARQMYESREFGAMPILADALQDAGCEDEQVLNHCRDARTPHVRGCWVVDLVLGKA